MNDHPALPFTGERFVPGIEGEIWIEHWHRYHFVLPWVAGLRILDVACGEGYGSALLSRRARSVAGVDLSQTAIDHAKTAYGGQANLSFHAASCTQLPFAQASFDCVVSFETVEHIHEQADFLAEIRRVLTPDGVLIMSSPNKAEYTDKRQFDNTYHVNELYRDEFRALVAKVFSGQRWLGQRNGFYSVIWEEGVSDAPSRVLDTTRDAAHQAEKELRDPLYFIVLASNSPQTLAKLNPQFSVFSDRNEFLYQDYRRVTRELRFLHDKHIELHAEFDRRSAIMMQALQELEALKRQS